MPRLLKPETCSGCRGEQWLHPTHLGSARLVRGGFSADEGHGTSGVLVVGEALGANEDADGLPFRSAAQAGSLLERAFKRCGFSRDQFRITNIVRCRPPHDHLAESSYEFDVIQHCRPNLLQSLASMKPRVILALGGTAARELTGMSGKKQTISYIRGYVLPCILPGFEGTPVVSTFHPSFLRQGKGQYFGTLCHDLQRAVAIARRSEDAQPFPTRYETHPTPEEARSFAQLVEDHPSQWLTYDIETPNSAEMSEDERDEEKSYEIQQIQFSLCAGTGIAFPFEGEYIEIARRIMRAENPKAGFYNHLFDDQRLRSNGFVLGGAPPHDLYEMWHHMQPDLPANLQFVASFYGMDQPWKHLYGSDLATYGCADVDAPQRILAQLPEQLKKRGLWDGYERLVYRVRPILDRMSERGIPINDTRRRAFGLELDTAAGEVNAEMQLLVPDELKNVKPKEGYKRTPKDTSGMQLRRFDVDSAEAPIDALRFEMTPVITWNGKGEPPPFSPMSRTFTERWCRVEPFKPSSQQMIRYMKHKGHPVPRNVKEDRDTTAAKELERLAKKTHDPLYRKVIWYRELALMKATFVDGWEPSTRDGRVHTTFTFAPATAQLSSRDPNAQNFPTHDKEGRDIGLADKFQRIIEAPPGYKIISFDHKSFHALTLAWLAEDKDYERIVRLDVHSFLAARFLRLKAIEQMIEMPDDELMEFLKWVKKNHRDVRDRKAKTTILRWGFGSGARSIYNDNLESFKDEAEVKLMVQALESSFPKTIKWRKQIQNKAHYDTFLVSKFGFIRWFWDVFNFGPNGQLRNGEQAEQAIAYLPANSAFGMMREEMLKIRAEDLDERFGYINTIHDSHVFCTEDARVEECLHSVKAIMEAPSEALGGLWCGVSPSVGQNSAPKSENNFDGKEEVNLYANITCGA